MKCATMAHYERKEPYSRSNGDQKLIETVTAHVERYLGPIENVFHDMLSDVVHLDILWVGPGGERDFHTLVTCGMSERPMEPPQGLQQHRHAELMLRLPHDWNISGPGCDQDRYSWPLQELEHLGRMPHIYHTWVWEGHIIANGDPPRPMYDGTEFCGTILARPSWTPEGFNDLEVDDERKVRFFSAIPLYADELMLSRDGGPLVFFDRMSTACVTDLLDPERPSFAGWTH